MKIKNIVILMFMIITVGLFPAKNHNSLEYTEEI